MRTPLPRSQILAAIAALGLFTGLAAQASAQATQSVTAAPDPATDAGWPRQFETATHVVRVHQPQVDEWPNFDRIRFRAAVVVQKKGSEDRAFGLIVASARADVAFEQRLVMLTDRKIEEITFPDMDPAAAAALKNVVTEAMPPQRVQTVSLDRIIAELKVDEASIRKVDLAVAPPAIHARTKPAIMVTFMGKPKLKAAPGGELMVAVNTNWDLFLEPSTGKYYLLNDSSWLTSDRLESGTWAPAGTPPASLAALPSDANWEDVKAALPGTKPTVVPEVLISTQPAELIVTEGEPEYQPLPGTRLMMVTNTENDLFYSTELKQFYVLAAGRWFSAPGLTGPWITASGSLPEDFRKIPEDSDAADVLASVPGTPAASEAVIMASLPNRATVNVAEITLNVTYDGEPEFRPIDKTVVRYAHNSPYSVFVVDGKYYCCHNALWFVSPAPSGAWTVATSVPAAIYTIPPTSPKYNVTYVTVYESTPTTVTTSYTAGYTGAQVAATGAVMFGLGLVVGDLLDDDDPCVHYHYHSSFFSYGCGARWHGPGGGWVCAGRRYGPYGGCGGFASYNPRTGVFSRGAYAYGPRGAAGFRSAYNPSTGVLGYRAGASTPYGSWGRAAISNGDDWMRAGYRSGPRGTAGAIQGSDGAAIGRVEGRFGNGMTVARGQDGDIYAGKDGQVYKKTDGGWEQAGNRTPAPRPATNDVPPRSGPSDYLKDRSRARDRGERNSERWKNGAGEAGRSRRPSGGGKR